MKKFLFGLMLVCIVMASCKKEHSKDPGTNKTTHKVVLNVGFSRSTVIFESNSLKINSLKENAADTALTNYVEVLYYVVYDSNGNIVHTIKQLSTDSNFGSYTDNLAAGTYSLIVAAGGQSLILSSDSYGDAYSLSTDVLSYGFNDPVGGGLQPWHGFSGDTFYKKITLTVTNADVSQGISLDRITSKLVVNIEDALPANAKTIYVECSPSYYFHIGSGTASPTSVDGAGLRIQAIGTVSAAQIGTTNYKVALFFLTSAPFSARVYCSSLPPPTDGNVKNIIADRTVPAVTGQPNKVTLLSGSLFGGATTHSTGGFTVSFDTTWNATPITKSF